MIPCKYAFAFAIITSVALVSGLFGCDNQSRDSQVETGELAASDSDTEAADMASTRHDVKVWCQGDSLFVDPDTVRVNSTHKIYFEAIDVSGTVDMTPFNHSINPPTRNISAGQISQPFTVSNNPMPDSGKYDIKVEECDGAVISDQDILFRTIPGIVIEE